MSKITIIGGSGFVGSFLTSKLNKKSVRIIDKNKSPFFNDITDIIDIRDLDNLKLNPKTELVVLLAAEHKDNVKPVSLYYDVNVQGTKNVLNAMDKAGIKKLIFTSSVAVYGLNKENPNENSPKDPFNHYGKSKLMAEDVIIDWFRSNHINKSVTIIRPTVIFGERNRGNVYNLLKQISSGKFMMVGHGRNKKSMAYIGNIVAFLESCIKTNQKYGVYNYVDTPDLTMNELISMVRYNLKGKSGVGLRLPFSIGMLLGYLADIFSKISGKNLPVSSIRIKKFTSSSEFESSKSTLDNFKAPFSLEEGLKRTWNSEFISPDPDREIFFTE